MGVTDRQLLAALGASGAVTVAAVLLLWFTAGRWFTPIAEGVGVLSAVAFAGLGLRWSFERLGDVYGD